MLKVLLTFCGLLCGANFNIEVSKSKNISCFPSSTTYGHNEWSTEVYQTIFNIMIDYHNYVAIGALLPITPQPNKNIQTHRRPTESNDDLHKHINVVSMAKAIQHRLLEGRFTKASFFCLKKVQKQKKKQPQELSKRFCDGFSSRRHQISYIGGNKRFNSDHAARGKK
ncbi:CLUMA_CG009746, isoform A [Clunio marinus]|uniref:CLUMA_CG009746, isoform A n=1 Tax=Clunio marinus TaxID=568069 RepID=A0A1J1I7P2_9DIPT|nr:CLUMA_CG009746, isoform A [Clunio marinus]